MPGPAFAPMVVEVRPPPLCVPGCSLSRRMSRAVVVVQQHGRERQRADKQCLPAPQGDMASDGGVGLGCLSWWASDKGDDGAAQGDGS